MLNEHQPTHIFCQIDDFCIELDEYAQQQLLGKNSSKRGSNQKLTVSEVMTLLISFQSIRFRHFKAFYTFAKLHWKAYFPKLVSYQRMVELIKSALLPLALFT